MLTPRRQAQLGLFAAAAVFLSSVSIIITGALTGPAPGSAPGLTASFTPAHSPVLANFGKYSQTGR